VQIDVEEKAPVKRRDQAQQGRGLFGGTVCPEGSIGIDGVCVPAMNAFVGPGTHAGDGEKIDLIRVLRRAAFEELQRAVNAARLVAVHTASDQHPGTILPRLSAAQREQPIAIGRVVELPVLLHVEPRREILDSSHDVIGVTAQLALPREPLRSLGRTPGNAGSADRIRSECDVHSP
jgi:hypothetical protein